jgi:hypothetical protein
LSECAYKHFNFTEGERLRPSIGLPGVRLPLHARNPDHFASRSHHKECPAGLAFVEGVDALVGLLVTDKFQGFVFARRHRGAEDRMRIYAFGSGREFGGVGL